MREADRDKKIGTARAAGRTHLTEPQALEVVASLSIGVPHHTVIADATEAAAVDLTPFPGDRVVIKVVSAAILHKSDVGGVAVVDKTNTAVAEAVTAMARHLEDPREDRQPEGRIEGYGIFEHVEHDTSFGGELLLGLRWTGDFGPVVTFGPGGVHTEHLAAHLAPGQEVAVLAPGLTPARELPVLLAAQAVTAPLTGELRGRRPRLPMRVLTDLLARWLDFAAVACPAQVAELEVNPLVITDRGPVALDAVLRVGTGEAPDVPAPRPLATIDRLLVPRSIAVVGVSRRMNPGRVLLRNVLAQGFPAERVRVVKTGVDEIDGCRAVPDLASLPGKMDLIVLVVEAAHVAALVEEVVARDLAESLILIPGGLGETEGSEERVQRLQTVLAEARRRGAGPVIVGGNCLGVRSHPGRYDTLFIPRHKLQPERHRPGGEPAPVAILSQSGAFAIARASRLPWLEPRYLITCGNQLDLTVADFLERLAEDRQVQVFACYVEGFQPLDGRRFLEVARRLSRQGRTVILYRAGRTPVGARAAASHTASIAGDWVVTRELSRAAGVVVAESLEDFEDLVRLFVLLRGRELDAGADRLAAVSNAGFECVALADSMGPFRPASFGTATVRRLREVLGHHRLEQVVGIHNPLDLTPIVGDAGFAEAARAVLEDDDVDLAVVGCVPLTGALSTLAAGSGHGEDVEREGSVARRLVTLWQETAKPWVSVVDSGALYDPMARRLEESGVPVFRTADRALRLLAMWAGAGLGAP